MEENEVNKIFKVKKTYLIASLVIIAIGLVLIGVAFYLDISGYKEPQDLHELIYNYEEEEGQYAKITAGYLPFGFAIEDLEDGQELKYYFIMDKDGYMYIVRITDETYEEMERQKEELRR